MGLSFKKTATIAAASQFLGTEFSARAKPLCALVATDLLLKMGSESKTWAVNKVWKNAAGSIVTSIIRQSMTGGGAPGANTDTDVVLTGSDLSIMLLPGEQLQIVTTGATAAMNAEIVYMEVDNSPTHRLHDPNYTR